MEMAVKHVHFLARYIMHVRSGSIWENINFGYLHTVSIYTLKSCSKIDVCDLMRKQNGMTLLQLIIRTKVNQTWCNDSHILLYISNYDSHVIVMLVKHNRYV